MDKQILDEYSLLHLLDYTQRYQGTYFHPEGGRDSKINESIDDIKADLEAINSTIKDTGNAVNDLLNNTVNRFNEIKKAIMAEKERYQDVQMLCNKFTDFDNIKSLEDIKFHGNYSEIDGAYCAYQKKTNRVEIKIIDVFGNGYEGNEYVYNNYQYQKNIYDTSIRGNITDNKISTYYEYSRLSVQDINKTLPSAFNRDSQYAKCTISFEASDIINFVNIETEDTGIYITNVQTSLDGIKYRTMPLKDKIAINNKLESYKQYGYVYGTGLLELPLCKYFKITFETDRNKGDVIAYDEMIEYSTIQNTGVGMFNYDAFFDPEFDVMSKIVPAATVVDTAKRSVIKLNNITAHKKIYEGSSKMQSEELINGDVYSISLFANVYCPSNMCSVTFTLIVNGEEYEVVPINSEQNGTKVLRFSGGRNNTIYTEQVNEKIKSAHLLVVFDNPSDASPIINNLKILLGGEL